jgi:flagellar biosynthesis GTPase FlhF
MNTIEPTFDDELKDILHSAGEDSRPEMRDKITRLLNDQATVTADSVWSLLYALKSVLRTKESTPPDEAIKKLSSMGKAAAEAGNKYREMEMKKQDQNASPRWIMQQQLQGRRQTRARLEERKLKARIRWALADHKDAETRGTYTWGLANELGWSIGKLNEVMDRIRARRPKGDKV